MRVGREEKQEAMRAGRTEGTCVRNPIVLDVSIQSVLGRGTATRKLVSVATGHCDQGNGDYLNTRSQEKQESSLWMAPLGLSPQATQKQMPNHLHGTSSACPAPAFCLSIHFRGCLLMPPGPSSRPCQLHHTPGHLDLIISSFLGL